MKVFAIIAIVFFDLYSAILSGQTSNRMTVIDLILKKHQPVKEKIDYSTEEGKYYATVKQKTENQFVSFCEPIPRFQLPHGAIVCRFEEYVQLHSPIKLNIGLGGE